MNIRRIAAVSVVALVSTVLVAGNVSTATAAPVSTSASALAPAAAPVRYILNANEMSELMGVEGTAKKISQESGKYGKIVLYSGMNKITEEDNIGAVGILNIPSKGWQAGVKKFAKQQGFTQTYSSDYTWQGTYTEGEVTLHITFNNIGDNLTTFGMAGGSYGNPSMVAGTIALAQANKLADHGYGTLGH